MARAKKVFCVIAYDISDNKRRLKVMKILEKYGLRINYSVYECMFTSARFQQVQRNIGSKLCVDEDSVVYYPICVDCYTRIVYQSNRSRESQSVVIV